MIKFEYKTILIKPEEIISHKLNKVGEEGWECFSLYFGENFTEAFCKRVKDKNNDV